MPIITCPTCGSKLEVAAEELGHTVECGGCQDTFPASTAPAPAEEKEEPDKFGRRTRWDDEDADRPRRRRYSDDNDRRYAGEHPQTGMGTAAMALGIVSLVLVLVFFPATFITALLGLIFGVIAQRTDGRKMGVVGIICSVIALLLALLLVAAYILFVYWATSTAGPGGGGGGGMVGGRLGE